MVVFEQLYLLTRCKYQQGKNHEALLLYNKARSHAESHLKHEPQSSVWRDIRTLEKMLFE